MSRKTRKLLWSAPLVAVFAVIGALAALATLSPGGVLAQDAMMGPPTGLMATANSQTQITLNWNAPASGTVNTYRIDMSEDGQVWAELVDRSGAGPNSTFVVVQGNTGRYVHGAAAGETGALTAGKTYHYRVFAIYATGGEGEPAATVMATTLPAKAPAPPTGLIVSTSTVPTAEAITLEWTQPTGTATGGSPITGYKIEASMASGRWQTLEEELAVSDTDTNTGVDGTQNEYTHEDLLEGTTWSYRISSVNKVGTGRASDSIEGTTVDGAVPNAPTGLLAQGTSSSVILVWQASDDQPGAPVTGYRIDRQAAADNPDTTDEDESAWVNNFATVGRVTQLNVGRELAFVNDQDDTDPTNDVTVRWQYRVSAINSAGTGTASSVRTNTTPPNPALNSAITNFKATAASQTQITLTWNDPLRTASGSLTHRIHASRDGRSWSDIGGGSDPAGNSFNHTGLKPGQTWYYRITAISGSVHEWSHVVRTTTKAARAPGAPTTLAATVVSATQIDLTWVAPVAEMLYGSTITGYRVERSTNQISWMTAGETKGTGLTYMDKGLDPGTMYYYRVRAMTEGGAGNASNIDDATTLDAAALGQPSGLVAFARRSSQIDLYWLTPGDPAGAPITGYRVEYSTDNGANWMDANANTMSRSTMWSHMGLMAETEYTYRVSAINSEGTGSPSIDDSATTPAASVPGMPMSVSAMATSDTEITVSWMAPANMGASAITGYMVQRAYMMSGGTMSSWMDTGCTGTALTCMDTGLMAETTYYYRVAASNAEGMGEYSDGMATATTEATPAELMAPMNIRVNPVGSGLVNVGWDSVSGAAGYTIVAVNTADPTQVMTESVNNPNAVAGQIGNLMVGGVYNIYVGSFDANLDFAVDLSLRKRVTVE